MIRTVFILSAVLCGIAHGSVEHGAGLMPLFSAAAPVPLPPPVVTSASSQYFERTFNRLVVPQTVVPVAPPPPVFNVGRPPAVFVQPTVNVPVNPIDNTPIQPNIAIAIATAQAAPVATILLPPYPFGPPPIGFVPPTPAVNVPDESRKESTTPKTTQAEVKTTTTTKQLETTTPLPLASNSDNNFVQALPSNENLNFDSYGVPRPQSPQQYTPQQQIPRQQGPQQPRPQQWPQQQRPQVGPQQRIPSEWPQHQRPQEFPLQQRPQVWPQQQRPQQWPQQHIPQQWSKNKPQKLRTSVEVVPVPLFYITPPPIPKYRAIKTVNHIHTFVPTKAKLIIRPVRVVSSPIVEVRVPARLVYRSPIIARGGPERPEARDIEPTTFRPFIRSLTKPPRM